MILESDPPRRLAMTFHAVWDEEVAADEPSRMTFEIEAAGPGVSKLTVVHDGFTAETETFRQVSGGWSFIASGLKTLLETGEPLMPAGRGADRLTAPDPPRADAAARREPVSSASARAARPPSARPGACRAPAGARSRRRS